MIFPFIDSDSCFYRRRKLKVEERLPMVVVTLGCLISKNSELLSFTLPKYVLCEGLSTM